MTAIAIKGTQWYLDGAISYKGSPAEGLLMKCPYG